MITLLIYLIIAGLILWLVETLLPIDPAIKLIIRVCVIIIVLLWLLQMFTGDIALPRFHR